ncbi:MAG: bifunctional nuclease family protein, partial [Acidimicrobiales bacterium]
PGPTFIVSELCGLSVELPSPHGLVRIGERDGARELVIPIGLSDADALAVGWNKLATARPLTHELLSEVMARLGGTLEAIRLIGRRAGVVLAELELSGPLGRHVLQCRPSDALSLAVRQRLGPPIMVDERLFGPGDVEPHIAAL